MHLGRPVALKLLAPGLAGDFRARSHPRVAPGASLSHPNIVTVYDAGEVEGLLYIAMELVKRDRPTQPDLSRAGFDPRVVGAFDLLDHAGLLGPVEPESLEAAPV